MQRGKLRHRVIVQAKSLAVGDYGDKQETWATWRRPWANIAPIPASERLISDRATETATHTVTVDYLEGLTADHRILHGSRVFNIHGIAIVDERRREMVLSCSEVN